MEDPIEANGQMAGMVESLNALLGRLAAVEAHLHHAAAAAAPAAPAASKPRKPDLFCGRRDAKDVRSWVSHLNIYFETVQEPPRTRANYAATLLREDALLWYQSLAEADRPTTWEALAEGLISYFAPLSVTIAARDRLAVLTQRTSVRAYTAEFKRLALNIPDLLEPEKLDRYVRNLRPDIRLKVRFERPATFERAVYAAEQADVLRNSVLGSGAADYYSNSRFQRLHPGGSYGPVPMEIGQISDPRSYADVTRNPPRFPKLTPEERSRLMANNGCFYCRGIGHRASQCPKRAGNAATLRPRITRASPQARSDRSLRP